jgi:ABC-type nickel/cobalt efflux system permease component RcnA
MKKIIIYLFLFQNLLFGCAACQLMNPTSDVRINLDIENKTVKNIHIKWIFSDLYTEEIIAQHDKNNNEKLDKKEREAVLQSMLKYITKKDMLTKIKYINKDENSATIKPEYKNFDIELVAGFLIFTYDSFVNIEIEDKSTLSLTFEDDESYFSFVVLNLDVGNTKLYSKQNIYLFTASVSFSDTPFENNNEVKQELNVTKQEELKKPEGKTTSLQANILKESIIKIKSLFESIKDEKNPLTYMFLLFFAYIYGVIHALGPGHGKTLVASYFLSNERSYSKALFISLAIGFVHTFSAFLLTLIIYFMVNTFLAQFLNDTVFYTTKISALIIISIAVYLIYKKYKAYRILEQMRKAPKYTFSTTPHVSTCGCSSCKVDNNSTDMALIISAGIIPCPGTTTIFIFAISLGLYYAGFVSAFVMSMGMSTIIFFSALLSVAVRKKTADSNSNLKKYLEYASLAVILILGIILLLS